MKHRKQRPSMPRYHRRILSTPHGGVSRGLRCAGVSIFTLVGGILVNTPPVSAHGDTGVAAVSSAVQSSGTTVDFDVTLSNENDGDPADGATVTLAGVASGDSAQRVGPVALVGGGEPGHYRATVEFPSAGDWEMTVSALEPEATLKFRQSVLEIAGSSSSTTVGSEAASSTSVGTQPLDDAVETTVEVPYAGDGSSTGLGTYLLIGAAAAVVAGAATFYLRRNSSEG